MSVRPSLAILAAGVAWFSVPFTAAPLAGGDDQPREAIQQLAARSTAVESVRLHAKGVLEISRSLVDGSPFAARQVGAIEYTYLAAGRKYKIETSTTGNLPIAPDFSVAYDGRQFELLSVRDRILSVRREDSASLPIALPNPFLLYWDFMNVTDEGCDGCMPRLADLRAKGGKLTATARLPPAASTPVPGVMMELEMPGSVTKGTKYVNHLFLGRSGAAWRQLGNESWTSDGRLVSRVLYHDFIAIGSKGAAFDFPTHITVDEFDFQRDGEKSLHLEYFVDSVEINRELHDGDFSLDRTKADKVWDSDGRKFLKGVAHHR
jgi:hypothetical protein